MAYSEPVDPAMRQLRRALGQAMRELRRERSWSQEDLAEAIPCHRTSIGRLERGLNSPTLEWLWQLAEAFDVSFAELAARIEKWHGKRGEGKLAGWRLRTPKGGRVGK